MSDYSLLFEDPHWLIYEKNDPYILIAYEFTSNQLYVAYRYVPETSDIAYNHEIYKIHENFIEFKFTCYWDETSKTYMQPIINNSETTKYSGHIWVGVEYLE